MKSHVERLGERLFLSRGADTFREYLKNQPRSAVEAFAGDSSNAGNVGFDDLLMLAHNYSASSGSDWASGDMNYDGSVGFDDLLALAQDYGVTGIDTSDSLGSDWNLAQNQVDSAESNSAFSVRLSSGKLIVNIGWASEDVRLSTRTSSTGRLRVFYSVGRHSQSQLGVDSLDASKVKSVYVFDNGRSQSITLDPSFPSATVYLNGGDDKIVANDAANTIYGGNGNDTIFAGGGDDVLYGEGGVDRLYGQGGTDGLDGGSSNDYLDGGAGRNLLVGGKGADRLTQRNGKDKLQRDAEDRVIS